MRKAKPTEGYRTPGPRDMMDNPVKLDECGHEVLDFGRVWEEALHPNSPEMRQAYAQYNAKHRDHQFRVPKFLRTWFKRNS